MLIYVVAMVLTFHYINAISPNKPIVVLANPEGLKENANFTMMSSRPKQDFKVKKFDHPAPWKKNHNNLMHMKNRNGPMLQLDGLSEQVKEVKVVWKPGRSLEEDKESQNPMIRDVVLEQFIEASFLGFKKKVKKPWLIPPHLKTFLADPISIWRPVEKEISMVMLNLNLTVEHTLIKGVKKLKIDFLRIYRDLRLTSIEVQIRLKTDLLVTGEYKMNGVVLGGVINLNRTDNYNITANNLSLSARALFEANRTANTLTVSELDFGLSREYVNVEVSSSVVHATIGLIKNTLLDYFFGHIASIVKEKYKEILVDLFQ